MSRNLDSVIQTGEGRNEWEKKGNVPWRGIKENTDKERELSGEKMKKEDKESS